MNQCNKCLHCNVCDGEIGYGYTICPQFKPKDDTIVVVRCKGCKYCDIYTMWNGEKYHGCNITPSEVYRVEPTHFCGLGKRRLDDE